MTGDAKNQAARVETNYSPGIGEAKFSLGRLNNHWVGFHWVSVNEGCLNGAWCSYSN